MSANTQIAATVVGQAACNTPATVISRPVGQLVVSINETEEDSPTWSRFAEVCSGRNAVLWGGFRQPRAEVALWQVQTAALAAWLPDCVNAEPAADLDGRASADARPWGGVR